MAESDRSKKGLRSEGRIRSLEGRGERSSGRAVRESGRRGRGRSRSSGSSSGAETKRRSSHSGHSHRSRKRRSSPSSDCSSDEGPRKMKSSKDSKMPHSKERSKHRKRKKYIGSESDSGSTSEGSDSSVSDSSPARRKSKLKTHSKVKERHKLKRKHKKTLKHKKKCEHRPKDRPKLMKKKRKTETEFVIENTSVKPPSRSQDAKHSRDSEQAIIKAAVAGNTTKMRGPMTKEEYERQQSIVRRVYDPDTGRHRLVKGDGEIIEEIVSRDQQKAINKQATLGDGLSFQAGLAKLL